MVTGCRQPNLEPIALRPKNALLPALKRSDVLVKEDGETERRIPRWCSQSFSGIVSPETVHLLDGRFREHETEHSPITRTDDLEAFRENLHCMAYAETMSSMC
jgi:hypothetical protein